jgi:mannose-6-phosphate isomerase-like protein (cupin superfamily)
MSPVIRSSELQNWFQMSVASGVTHAPLETSSQANEVQGANHGSGLSVIFVDAAPGGGPSLRRHAYEEVFIVQAGHVTFTLGTAKLDALPGDIVIAPAGTPHAFVNSGEEQLRMTAIHHAPSFLTEWLSDPPVGQSAAER